MMIINLCKTKCLFRILIIGLLFQLIFSIFLLNNGIAEEPPELPKQPWVDLKMFDDDVVSVFFDYDLVQNEQEFKSLCIEEVPYVDSVIVSGKDSVWINLTKGTQDLFMNSEDVDYFVEFRYRLLSFITKYIADNNIQLPSVMDFNYSYNLLSTPHLSDNVYKQGNSLVLFGWDELGESAFNNFKIKIIKSCGYVTDIDLITFEKWRFTQSIIINFNRDTPSMDYYMRKICRSLYYK